jgi:serine/threonine protein phosphatase PrpC
VSGYPSLHFFGVCDGHGQYGRDVSTFVKNSLPVVIEKNYKRINPDESNYYVQDPYRHLK